MGRSKWPVIAGKAGQLSQESVASWYRNQWPVVARIRIDHGPHDNATESFFRFQGQSFKSRRGFMGDVYGILDGVALGLGKAVMSKHLVENDSRFRIIPSKKKYIRPLILSYFKQSYYPSSHLQLRDSISNF